MNDQQMLKAAVQALAVESRRGLEPHPASDVLLAYQAGLLPEVDRERIQEHLALCPDCARILLDLAAFPAIEPLNEEERLSGDDLAAEWQRFREAVASAPPTRFRRRFSPAVRPYLIRGLAAALAVAVLGLSLWLGRLRRQIADLSGPRVNLEVAELALPERAAERGVGTEEEVRVLPGTERLVLILGFTEARRAPITYRVEIAKTGGGVLWSRGGLRPGIDGNFTLEVPLRLLPPGSYRIRLYGATGGERPAVEYALRILSR